VLCVERGLLLQPSSTTNGSQHNTLHPIAGTLNRANSSSIGIQQSLPALPDDPTGAHSDNKYYTLNVSNAAAGVSLAGNSTWFDVGNLIGVIDNGQTVIGGASAGDIGGGPASPVRPPP